MAKLTIVGFASGSPLSRLAMKRVARAHRLVAIVAPPAVRGIGPRLRRFLGRNPDPFAGIAAPLVDAAEVERLRPDVIVVATYPHILGGATLAAVRLGAFNIHMSLLPRHRGVDPIFWTYWHDDHEAGVTIHWIDERIDAGDVAAQESMPLERGVPSRETYMQLAAQGVDLLEGVLGSVDSGKVVRNPQDEKRASYGSEADIARARIPFSEWPAERVWHVLSGLGDQRFGLLGNLAGQALMHGRATHFRVTHEIEPGRVDDVEVGYELHCKDGIVRVDRHA